MEEVIKLLETTDEIYTTKLDDCINKLKETQVVDEEFNKLLDTTTKLIGLKLQKIQFVAEYNESKGEQE